MNEYPFTPALTTIMLVICFVASVFALDLFMTEKVNTTLADPDRENIENYIRYSDHAYSLSNSCVEDIRIIRQPPSCKAMLATAVLVYHFHTNITGETKEDRDALIKSTLTTKQRSDYETKLDQFNKNYEILTIYSTLP